MPLTRSQARTTVERYLARYPDERKALAGLLSVLDGAADPCSRGTLPGHVTCSAVVIDRDRRVLHIGHEATGRLRAPGGHAEDDRSLLAAALRGVHEETGIPSEALCLTPQFLDTPIDIDVHDVDACPVRDEPAHQHVDVRFAFYLTAERPPELALQEAKGCGAQWLSFTDVRSPTLRARLLSAQGLDGRPEPVNASALIHDGHGRYLLHLRDDRDGIWEPWTLALLGGGREPGDACLEATLRRELGEETPGLHLTDLAPYSVEKARSVDGLTVAVQVFAGRWNGDPHAVRLREGVLLRWFTPDTLGRLRLSPGLGDLIRRHAAEHPPSDSPPPAHDRLLPGEAPKGTEPHIVGVHLYLEDEQGRILLGLRHPDSTFAPNQWHLLAGHCEREEAVSCLVREAEEEAGLTIKPHNVELVHVLHLIDAPSARPRLGLFFRARTWSGTPTLLEPDKCVQWRWWNPKGLPDHLVPYTRQAIEEVRAGCLYSQRGWASPDGNPAVIGPAPGPATQSAEVDPAAARAAMVARLEESGALGPGPVRTALLALSREVLMPQAYVRRSAPGEEPLRWDLPVCGCRQLTGDAIAFDPHANRLRLVPGADGPTLTRRPSGPVVEFAEQAVGRIAEWVNVSWARENCCVWRAHGAQDGTWYVKVHQNDTFHAREVRAYRTWTGALGAAVPRLVAAGEQLRTIVVTAVAGQVLHGAVLNPAQERDVFAALGALARRIHRAASPQPAPDDAGPAVAKGERHLAAARPHLAPGDEEFIRRLVRHAEVLPPLLCVETHGDFQLRNILRRDDGSLALIDFERSEPGPAVRDFVRLSDAWASRSDLYEAFMAGYGRALTAAEEARLVIDSALDAVSGVQFGVAHGDVELVERGHRTLARLRAEHEVNPAKGVFVKGDKPSADAVGAPDTGRHTPVRADATRRLPENGGEGSGWMPTAVYAEKVPKATCFACVYFTDEDDRPLQLHSVYSPGHPWQLVGGTMDPGERPFGTAVRECQEETGLTPFGPPRLLAMVYGLPGAAWPYSTVGAVFDGGRLTEEQIRGIALDPSEHDEARVLPLAEWEALMPPRDFARLSAVARARRSRVTAYFDTWDWETE